MCKFCQIYKNKQELVGESDYFFFIFDIFPVQPGHLEIISKRHVESILNLSLNEWSDLKQALIDTVNIIENTDFKELYTQISKTVSNKKVIKFCQKMLVHKSIDKKPDGYNIGVNEGRAAGRTIDHLHIHIIPRFFGDVKDCVGGIRNIIPGMGDYIK